MILAFFPTISITSFLPFVILLGIDTSTWNYHLLLHQCALSFASILRRLQVFCTEVIYIWWQMILIAIKMEETEKPKKSRYKYN